MIADPCHIFHRPVPGIFFHGLSGNARCQNAGLINTYLSDPKEGFDSIFLGTSMSGNFKAENAAAKNHLQRTLKLTLPGAFPIEQQIMAERALEAENVRHVFWEIFPYQFLKSGSVDLQELKKKNEFPAYLYNRSRIDDYRYVFNFTSFGALFDIVRQIDYYNGSSIDRIGYWDVGCDSEKICQPFHLAEDIAKFVREYQTPHNVHRSDEEISKIDYSSVDKYLLATLLPYCNASTRFDLFMPPVSLLWASWQSATDFDFQLYMLRYVVAKTSTCKNIRFFAFDDELWITGDLAHYHDPRHFYGGVHDYILDSMATGKHLMTMENIEAFEQRYIENVNNYVPWASTAEQMRNSPY